MAALMHECFNVLCIRDECCVHTRCMHCVALEACVQCVVHKGCMRCACALHVLLMRNVPADCMRCAGRMHRVVATQSIPQPLFAYLLTVTRCSVLHLQCLLISMGILSIYCRT